MVNLGRMELRELNLEEGRKWLYRAAEKGNHAAQEAIHEFKLDKIPEGEIDPEVKCKCDSFDPF